MSIKVLLWPLSLLYGLGVYIRNKLFDQGIMSSREFDIPVVSVGNLTVGGTGKTPMCELLIEHLSQYYNVALLSRGYKRRTKGFLEVTVDTPFMDSGDEPKQIKLKFPDTLVAVCEKRAEGIVHIRRLHPEVNLIILDDAFQHRQVEAWANIVLMDYSRPVYRDHLLPLGSLRDLPSQLHRANFVVVTKCPDDINPLEMRIVRKSLGLFPYQGLYFSQMRNGRVVPLFPDCATQTVLTGSQVIVMAGVGSPASLLESIRSKFQIVDTLLFADHHPYRMADLERMAQMLRKHPQAVILTTEKDAVKLTNRKKIPAEIQRKLFFIPVRIEFLEDSERDFIHKIYHYVRSNQKYSLLHSQ